MPLKFTHGVSPVCSSVLFFSYAALFFSARSMALTSLICCWLVNLSSLVHFSSPVLCFSGLDCFQEPHGVMPDLCLSVRVFYPCYSSCACVISLLIHHYGSRPRWAKCSYQMSYFAFCTSRHRLTSWHLSPRCITAFVSHLFLSDISSPLMERAFVGTVCKCQMDCALI